MTGLGTDRASHTVERNITAKKYRSLNPGLKCALTAIIVLTLLSILAISGRNSHKVSKPKIYGTTSLVTESLEDKQNSQPQIVPLRANQTLHEIIDENVPETKIYETPSPVSESEQPQQNIEPQYVTLRANQALHSLINSVPIDSLVLRSPRFDSKATYGIVFLVISATNETKEREEIRRTWASRRESKLQKTDRSLLIFLVGRSSELDQEVATYSDLLQVDIEDSYRNLVYKIEVGFRWLEASIKSQFVAKIDSDTVVHIDRLYGQLLKYDKERGYQDWIECKYMVNHFPFRDLSSPWYVSKEDYPYEIYPIFCSGPGYVMKRVTFEKIVAQMKNHKIIEPEDVFFTGIVANDFVTHFNKGTVVIPFTEFSTCDSDGPVLSILNTDLLRDNKKSRNNLTTTWERLKNPSCITH